MEVDGLRSFCRERLSGYKVRGYVEFKEILPINMVGKHLRGVLMEETLAKIYTNETETSL